MVIIKNKYKFFICTAVFLADFFIFGGATKVFASLQITEIMYSFHGSDTTNGKSREWIEIYNPDSDSVDITKIKLREADTNHGISTSSGTKILNSLEYAVIADTPVNFMVDNPNYLGILFDSSWPTGLSNTGESLELRDASSTTLDLVTYDSSIGANGDGNSLQKINNVWRASAPTPGLENIFAENNSTSTTCSSFTYSAWGACSNNTQTRTVSTSTPDGCTVGTPAPELTQSCTMGNSTSTTTGTQTTRVITRTVYVSTHSSEEDLSDYQEKPVFETSAGRQRIAYVGAQVEFSASYKMPKDLESNLRIFEWSFGDGLKDSGEKVAHTYKYPGEYSVVLNGASGNENSVSRTTVKVLSPNIHLAILPAGDIEITNNGNTEINLGLWKLRDISGTSDFVFPKDTIVGADKKITLSKDDTKIQTDNNRISIVNPSNGEVFAVDNRNNMALSSDDVVLIEKAKTLAAGYKKSPTLNNEKVSVSASTSNKLISGNLSPTSSSSAKSLSNTASALISVEATSTKSFFKKAFDYSFGGIKAVAKLFYDF